MKNLLGRKKIFVAGDQRLAATVSVALLLAGEEVWLTQETGGLFSARIDDLLTEAVRHFPDAPADRYLHIADEVPAGCELVLLFAREDPGAQAALLSYWEKRSPAACTVAICMDAVLLSELQPLCSIPTRLLGMNWVEPAHTTKFLEIISNEKTDPSLAAYWHNYAQENWQKDPYRLTNGFSIRGRLMAALIREALWLVDKEYVEREDIDRACRNDPGYYLPFSGHFRYMDIMGTFIYGIVMKDLNPSLSKDTAPPAFFQQILLSGARGMENGEGFYHYAPGEAAFWDSLLLDFSYQVTDLMNRYPGVK